MSNWFAAVDGLVLVHDLPGASSRLTATEWSEVFYEAEKFDQLTGRKFCKEHILRNVLADCKLWAKFTDS